jgi:ABC-type Fe3+ transport system substrate-binding protein
VAKYASPEGKSFPEEFKDPQGWWIAVDAVTRILAYNTKMVGTHEVPKSFADLLDPKWKGKMALPTRQTDWFHAVLRVMGEEKGIEYMKKLAKQEISFHTGKTLITQLLSAGEFPIAIVVNASNVETAKRKGAPVEWVGIEPVAISSGPIVVMAHASNPNTARLFVDFMLSKEGQKIVVSRNRVSLRPDVPPNPPRLVQGLKFIHPDPILIEKMQYYTKMYQDIFLKAKR